MAGSREQALAAGCDELLGSARARG